MFITTKVFNPVLEGKAVELSGAIEGNYIVAKVHDYEIEVVGKNLKVQQIPLYDFEHNAVELRVLELLGRVIHDDRPDKGKHQGNFTRKHTERKFRKMDSVQQEIKDLENILKESSGPMRLAFIIRRMNGLGHAHWNNNNSSGFVKHAIRSGGSIHNVSIGYYAFGRKV